MLACVDPIEPMSRRSSSKDSSLRNIHFHPLSLARWADLERLFGKRGACGGCWCMYWIRTHSQFERDKGNGNKRAFKKLVAAGDELGLVAYDGREPVGWCAFGPRERYVRLANSRILRPVDQRPVWSVVCFFVAKGYRRLGMSIDLLRAAARHAEKRGARLLEGYPVEPMKGTMPAAFAWTGLASAFRRAGFREVLRRSETRPILRKRLGGNRVPAG